MFLPRESIGDGPGRTQPHHVALNRPGEISHKQMPVPCREAAQPVEMEWRFKTVTDVICSWWHPAMVPVTLCL
jgi:hypothetical protein